MANPECARPSRAGAVSHLTRRSLLSGIAGALVVAPPGGLLGACGKDEPDPLASVAARASADAALIDQVRTNAAVPAETAGLLTELARARRAHAAALATAISGTSTPAPAPTPRPPSKAASPDPHKALAQVRGGLQDAQRQAGTLVGTLPRSRAGLLGSIAACCAAYREVLT
ncbi:MAG TPA: hypothetical protein VGM60_12905 [Pseudonocardia sp.]|uniref:hypothetical protein n=1 Tax=Pseudonocardia sp. TaxID=60912 RepID=UPI002F41A0DB